MRIISGSARGTKLYTLEGNTTRPTLDRVKESVFNIIQERIPGSIFLDLFSGSGAIGLEAASRGANKVILCDNSKDAICVINKNILKTHMQDKVKIYSMSFDDLIKNELKQKIDLIYIDPPYKTNYVYKSIKMIIEHEVLNENGLIILETDEEQRILEQISELKIKIIDQRKYGRAHLIFLEGIR